MSFGVPAALVALGEADDEDEDASAVEVDPSSADNSPNNPLNFPVHARIYEQNSSARRR